MTQRKINITGYYGQKTDVPFNFIPDGIKLNLLIHREDGSMIKHDINIDNEKVTQFIDYNKPRCGCGSFAGTMVYI